jgi:hypothetical protein
MMTIKDLIIFILSLIGIIGYSWFLLDYWNNNSK